MDPLSISASVAGLITLADVVIDRTYKTVITCKNAGKDAERLLQETTTLLGILKSLDALGQHVPPEQVQHHLPIEQVKSCQSTLEQIRDKLEKGNPTGQKAFTKLTRSLLWPVTKAETDKFLDQMDRYKATFSLCISMDVLNKVAESSLVEQHIGNDILSMQTTLTSMYRIVLDEKRNDVLSSVGAFMAESIHYANLSLRQAGTGQWLLRSTEFESWLNNRGSKLWCFGIPGAGKSVLAALSVLETMDSTSPKHAVAYFYCDYKHLETQDLGKIMLSLAGQLARQNEKCFKMLESEASAKTFAFDCSRIQELLLAMIRTFEEVSIIVDGLDECEDPARIITGLMALTTKTTSLRTLFFSRDEPLIRDGLQGFKHVSIAARKTDLSIYVAAQLEEKSRQGRLRIRSISLKDDIIDKLVNGADGMFRWVSCQLDHLCNLRTDKARRQALLSLPPNLSNTYERILERVNEQGPEAQTLLERTLHWTFAKFDDYVHLPLLASELCKAVAVEESDTHLDPEAIPEMSEILAMCSSLLRLSPNRGRLESAHFTVEEYLKSIDPETHPHIARYKMSEQRTRAYCRSVAQVYCAFPDFAYGLAYTEEQMDTRYKKDPLYFTLADIWPAPHDARATIPQMFQRDRTKSFVSWAQLCVMHLAQEGFGSRTAVERSLAIVGTCTPLHFAAMFHLNDLLEPLIKHGYSVNDVGALGSVLQCALLGTDAAAIVMKEATWGFKLLRVRESKKCCKTVATLIRLGADVHCPVIISGLEPADQQRSITWLAFLQGSLDEIVEAGCKLDGLTIQHLQHDLEEYLQSAEWLRLKELPSHYFEPSALQQLTQFIMEAANYHIERAAQKAQADDEAKKNSERQALDHAVRYSDDVVLNWLSKGFDVNATTFRYDTGDTLLHVAVQSGRYSIIQWLIDQGADPNAVNDLGMTPLHTWAAMNSMEKPPYQQGMTESVEALLASNVDPSMVDHDGDTFLHICARFKPSLIEGLTTERGDDPHGSAFDRCLYQRLHATANVANKDGFRPWLCAIRHLVNTDMTEKESDSTNLGFYEESPPADARFRRCEEAIRLLLEASDKQLRPEEASALPLHTLCMFVDQSKFTITTAWARYDKARDIFSPVLQELLQLEVDIASRDAEGQTCIDVLIQHLSVCHTAALTLLVDRWPRRIPIVHEHWAVSALCLAVANDDEHLGVALLDAGVDSNAKCAMLSGLQLEGWSAIELVSAVGCPPVLATRCLASIKNPNVCDANGHGMIHMLSIESRKQKHEILSAFLRLPGVDINLPSRNEGSRDMTALMLAASDGDVEACEILATAGASTNVILDIGKTALDYACRQRLPKADLVRILISHGAKPTNVACDGSTALLQVAARFDQVGGVLAEITRLLLDNGSVITTIDLPATVAPQYFPEKVDIRREPTKACSEVFGQLRFSHGPLQLAAASGDMSVYAVLADHARMQPVLWEHLVTKHMLSPLWIACANGNIRLIKRLLAGKADVEFADHHLGLRCIHAAVLGLQLAVIRLLLDQSCDLESKDCCGRSPLALAEQLGHQSIVTLLQTHLLSLRSRSRNIVSQPDTASQYGSRSVDLLVRAIKDDDLELVKSLSPYEHQRPTTLQCRRCTPLLMALALGRTAIADHFVGQTWSPDDTRICNTHNITARGYNSIHLAAVYSWHFQILRKYLSRISAEGLANWPVTPLHVAAAHGCHTPIHALPRSIVDRPVRVATDWPQCYVNGTPCPPLQVNGNTALHIAASLGHVDFVQLLVRDQSPDLNARNHLQQTPLYLAVQGNNRAIVHLLSNKHADPNVCDNNGATPLHVAAHKGLTHMLSVLKGADLEARDLNGSTAMTIACWQGHIAFVATLLSAGFSFGQDFRDLSDFALLLRSPNPHAGSFALSLKLCMDADDVLWGWQDRQVGRLTKFLRTLPKEQSQACLDFRHPNNTSTALYQAASQGQIEVVRLLLRIGADLNILGGPVGSALMAACWYGRFEVAQLLVRCGASLFCTDESGTVNAVQFAMYHQGIIDWLLVGRFTEQRKLCAS